MWTGLRGRLHLREAQELLEQAQPGGPASFGMELHAYKALARDRANEGHAMGGVAGNDPGMARHDDVGVHEIEGLALCALQHRVRPDVLEGVPADVGELFMCLQP